jgi:hypothetical protein
MAVTLTLLFNVEDADRLNLLSMATAIAEYGTDF